MQHSVLISIAIREVRNSTKGVKDKDDDSSHHFFNHSTVFVVGC
jgi:hypothetical protein